MNTKTLLFVLSALLCASAVNSELLADDTAADREFTFAVRLLERGEHKLAKETLDQFIAKFAGDARVADAHYYLAVLARRGGDLDAAERHLALVQNPRHVTDAALRVLRGQVKLERGMPAEALAELEQVKADSLTDDASRATWNYLLGSAYRGSGNVKAAADRFAEAAKPDTAIRATALVELGKARAELKQAPEAIQALAQALAANPAPDLAAEARSLAADLAYGLKQYDQAADLYQQVVQQHQASPAFGPAVVGVMRSLFAAGKYDQVIKQYEATRTLIPREQLPDSLYLLGTSLVQLQQYAPASERFLEFYRLTQGEHRLAAEVSYHHALCLYHLDLNAFEKWVASFEKDLPRMSRGPELQFLRAQAAISRQKPDEAIKHLTPLIDGKDAARAKESLAQRAALYEQVGQPSKAAADYALYSQRFGDDPGALDAGRRAIDLAFRSGQFQVVIDLSAAWLARKDVPPAQAAEVRLKVALSQIKLNHPDEALAALDALLKSKPNPAIAAQTQYWRGVILASKTPGDAAAITALREAATGPLPEDQKAAAIALIAQQHVKAGREKDALDAYEELRALRPPDKFDPAVAVWVGRGLAQAGRNESALLWLAPATSKPGVPDAVKAEALYHTGESLRRLNRFDQAIETYRHLIALSRGYEAQGRLGLAHALLASGKLDEALGEFDGLVAAEASEVAAEALLQSALLRLADPQATRERDEARKRLNRIVILFDVPQLDFTVAHALVTLGLIDSADGDKPAARKQFDSVVSRKPKSPWHEAAQAELLILDGNLGGAAAMLRKMYHESANPVLKAHAEQRLKAIGERP